MKHKPYKILNLVKCTKCSRNLEFEKQTDQNFVKQNLRYGKEYFLSKKKKLLKQCLKEFIYECILVFGGWWSIFWEMVGSGGYILTDGGWWWIYFCWWWVVVDIFWLVVGGSGYIFDGGGWSWMVGGRSGLWNSLVCPNVISLDLKLIFNTTIIWSILRLHFYTWSPVNWRNWITLSPYNKNIFYEETIDQLWLFLDLV